MNCQIVAVVEHSEGHLASIAVDVAACAANMAKEKGWRWGILGLGYQLTTIEEQLSGSGADDVFIIDDKRLEEFNSSLYLSVIVRILTEMGPRLILISHSYAGIELAAGIAPRLSGSLVANCRSMASTKNGYLLTRSMFGGKFIATVEADQGGVLVATIASDYSTARHVPGRSGDIVRLPFPMEACASIQVLETLRPTRKEDITKAEIVVAVGRGIRQPNQLEAFRQLAQILGAAFAASRPLVDAGWLTADYQVGLSGVTVKPKVYLAFGISGSAQHLAGMKQSKLIVAINNDASAPIFQVAHYGVVADMFEILPSLLEKAKADNSGLQPI